MVNPTVNFSNTAKNQAGKGTILAVILTSGPVEDLMNPLAGHPLLAYSLATALQSYSVGKVIVTGDPRLVENGDQICRDLNLPADKVSFLTIPGTSVAASAARAFLFAEGKRELFDLAGDRYDTVALLDPRWPLHPKTALDTAAAVFAEHEPDVKIASVAIEPAARHWWALPGKEILAAVTGPQGSQLYAQTGHFELFSPVHIDKSSGTVPLILEPDYNVNVSTNQGWERADWLLQYSRLDVAYPGCTPRPLPERVALLVMDFDGVLTDNRVWVSEDGHEMVAANRSDSLGMGILRKAGIEPMVLSMETNPVVADALPENEGTGAAGHQRQSTRLSALPGRKVDRSRPGRLRGKRCE